MVRGFVKNLAQQNLIAHLPQQKLHRTRIPASVPILLMFQRIISMVFCSTTVGFVYGRLSSVVSKNERSVINKVADYVKQTAPTHNVPAYQPYAMPYGPGAPSAYTSYVPEPVPAAIPSYAHNPQPQPSFAYYRATGWGGYAHSLDQFTSYGPKEENKELLQPQVLSRGFQPKKKKGRTGPPQTQPTDEKPPPQYTQPSVPYPPFLPGTKFPQHGTFYPYQYPYDYTTPWYDNNYGSTTFMQPSIASEQIQTQAPIKPQATEDMKLKTEKTLPRLRSNSDATNEEEKEEKAGSARNNSIDSSEHSATTEFKEVSQPHLKNKGKGGYKKNKQKVKWVKKVNSDIGAETEQVTESVGGASYLKKVEEANDKQKRGVATKKEALIAEGQRTYYNVGGINTPQRQPSINETTTPREPQEYGKPKDTEN